MPPKRKVKPREQRIAEEFFPVDKDDLKMAVEKPVKQLEQQAINQIMHSKPLTEKKQRKYSKTKKIKSQKEIGTKTEEFSPKKITLKRDGYELIITEKPQAAAKIANALGKAVAKNAKGVPYYELTRQDTGQKIIVACAVGHLFTLKQKNKGTGQVFPVFDIAWVPNYLARNNLKPDFSKKYYDAIYSLAKGAGSITVATDYDIEGEVIGLNIVRFICGQEDAARMKFSTLTEQELNNSYKEKSRTLNWGQAIAGETRHYLDWYYGINLSRALMAAIKSAGGFRIMSIGRVQGPTLNLIVKKEKEILSFKPQPYWQVFIKLKKHQVELKYIKDIFRPSELKQFQNLKGKKANVSTEKTQQILVPNPPFNLTSLQTEAYAFYGITPANTLKAAQSLYLAGLISYPRTSSQKLPPSINYSHILNKVSKKYNAEHLIKRENPVEGKKTDPAHPSIYPTGSFDGLEKLHGDELKIYDLISKRFISLFCEDAVVDNKTIKAEINLEEKKISNNKKQGNEDKTVREDKILTDKKTDFSSINNKYQSAGEFTNEPNPERMQERGEAEQNVLIFTAKGSSIKNKGWMAVYPSKIIEKNLPDIEGKIEISDLRTEQKETQPPRRFSPASIISELEKRNLGTKATRAAIIETLYERGYIKEKSIEATPLGISLISTLEKHSPIIIDEALTRSFEKEMESLLMSKKDLEKKQEAIKTKAKETIKKIAEQFEKEGKKIGLELLKANEKAREIEKEKNKITICPSCKKGSLSITYSRKNRRFFIACDAYPECKTTFSLPPNGIFRKTEKQCEKCGFPMLMSIRKGKKPWVFCFNRDCETNKERIEEYRKKQAENDNYDVKK